MSERLPQKNVNTAQYWDSAYFTDIQGGHARLFGSRLEHVMRWVGLRASELNGSSLRFLDIGCGLGDLAARVAGPFPNSIPYGVDISGIAIEFAQAKFPDGSFLKHDVAQPLPCADERFDFVWCGEVLEHVDDPDLVASEACRVTKPGGIFVLSTPYKNRIGGDEHVWSHSSEDMFRWAHGGSEILFYSYDVLQDAVSTMMMIVVRK